MQKFSEEDGIVLKKRKCRIQAFRREAITKAIAFAYKVSVGKLLRKQLLALGFQPLEAVNNQEIGGQQRSEG
ncbi:hypothetical protein [Paenibacillus macquariensis]|uniref:Transposase n=1 Tax=Paenibacillus macquariensis TaxID=948756 RepID=A0ABY1K9J4_9BACL|nr:hypothetical protein [Paenibacillus macquariensis]MEC0091632.1 hypothetical protein [Paenibacillus macquariensis]OAB26751.1 hypothetical protein PMSM_26705 [Paenibacillus macquariensis subsp. macquariensis]SIR46061.1 hypothetical protein SAMN05421578_114146 [Paenibacillus macquariensis]